MCLFHLDEIGLSPCLMRLKLVLIHWDLFTMTLVFSWLDLFRLALIDILKFSISEVIYECIANFHC